MFVVVFLAIHPFQDGNGWLPRVLTMLLLLRAGHNYVTYASLESVLNDIRIDNEDLLLIRVYDEDEKPLVRWNGGTDESDPYVLRRDVTLQGEKFGRVEVGWKSDWITRRVDSYAGRLSYFLVTVLALLAGIIILLIHMLVVRPVHDIDRRLKREVCADPASAGPRIRSMEFHRLSDSVDRFHKLLWQKEEATRELEEFVPLSMH